MQATEKRFKYSGRVGIDGRARIGLYSNSTSTGTAYR
jgi:hypothetical protein